MLAMQYSVRLPTDYTTEEVQKRVSRRGPMFDGYPGLAHKFYLYDEDAHIYAPLYLWETSQAAGDFLMDSLFGDVVKDFGRPRVRSWQILEFGYGPSEQPPLHMHAEVDKVGYKQPLTDLKARETDRHQKILSSEGLFAHMVLLDPDRWEISHCSFWSDKDQTIKSEADSVYDFRVIPEN
ncbi:MAG: DUF4865 family protein [Sneathiella sp.]|nr:DUF4865 family protein [Sneathiella sp.]